MGRVGLDWVGLRWVERCWVVLGHFELGWVGLRSTLSAKLLYVHSPRDE